MTDRQNKRVSDLEVLCACENACALETEIERLRAHIETSDHAHACAVQEMSGEMERLRAAPDAIANEARRYAGHYPNGSDGRNTFILLAEWIESRGYEQKPGD